MEETLQQILFELKELKKSQAVVEETTTQNRHDIVGLRTAHTDAERNQAVLEQGMTRINERLGGMQTDMADMRTDMADMRTDITDIRTDITDMRTDMTDMRTDITDMQTDITDMQTGMTTINKRLADMRTDMTDMRTDITDIRTDLTKFALTQENDVLPRIQLLYEGQSELAAGLKKLKDVPAQIEDIQNTVSVLKYAVKAHTHD